MLAVLPHSLSLSDGGDETPLSDGHGWGLVMFWVYLEGSQAASGAELARSGMVAPLSFLSTPTSVLAAPTPFPGPPLACPPQAAPGPLTLVWCAVLHHTHLSPEGSQEGRGGGMWRGTAVDAVPGWKSRLTPVGEEEPSSHEADEPRADWVERSLVTCPRRPPRGVSRPLLVLRNKIQASLTSCFPRFEVVCYNAEVFVTIKVNLICFASFHSEF